MAQVRVDVYVRMLECARRETLAAANRLSSDKRFRQIAPGRATPVWLLGHLATSADAIILGWMLNRNGVVDPAFGMPFAPDFAGGKAPTTNPDDYPAWEEILATYDRAMANAIDAVRALEDDALPTPLRGEFPEQFREFFSSIEATLGIIASHDSYHRGQMVLLGTGA